MKNQGFLVDMGEKGKRLKKKEKLLECWVNEYPVKLRPRLLLGRFTGTQDWWQNVNFDNDRAWWGSEVASAMLTKYLKPQNITVYMKGIHMNTLIMENRLKRDNNGEIEILERFWRNNREETTTEIVHPVLIYADLMATADQRNIETAKVIFEKYLGYIRED